MPGPVLCVPWTTPARRSPDSPVLAQAIGLPLDLACASTTARVRPGQRNSPGRLRPGHRPGQEQRSRPNCDVDDRHRLQRGVVLCPPMLLHRWAGPFAKMLFGTSSEKDKRVEPPEASVSGESAVEGAKRRPRGQQPGSKGHGRRDRSGRSTKEVVHDVPEGERVCPFCGAAYTAFGEECSEQIDWQVRLCRIVHRRPT